VNISYTGPLSRAWERMKSMLFRPFHIETWFVVGFAQFLAGLFSHTGSAANWSNGWKDRPNHGVDVQTEQAFDRFREGVLAILDKPLVLAAIAAVLIMLMIVVVALAWVSARAEFVFLDNVATRRAGFMEPWHRYGRLGRSLFLWRAVYSFAYLVPLAFILLPFAGTLSGLMRTGRFELPAIAAMVVGILVGGTLAIALSWIYWMMNSFVIPLMYRYQENATQAWSRFRPLLLSRLGSFLAFTVFYIVVAIAAGIGVAIIGFGTCCIGIVLMIIPYIGNVVLLPVTVTSRGLGPEFLAQFGPEWETFPAREDDEDTGPVQPVI
jgi:hypothetical protein